MSGRCVPPAYGSLSAYTSPAASRRRTAPETPASRPAPTPGASGSVNPCAISRPSGSHSAADRSIEFFRCVDRAVRTIATAISSTSAATACRNSSRCTGSTDFAACAHRFASSSSAPSASREQRHPAEPRWWRHSPPRSTDPTSAFAPRSPRRSTGTLRHRPSNQARRCVRFSDSRSSALAQRDRLIRPHRAHPQHRRDYRARRIPVPIRGLVQRLEPVSNRVKRPLRHPPARNPRRNLERLPAIPALGHRLDVQVNRRVTSPPPPAPRSAHAASPALRPAGSVASGRTQVDQTANAWPSTSSRRPATR